MPSPDFIGKICGNYVFRRLLDQGGVGMVFIGEHRFLDEKVAIKVLHSHADSNDSDLARRFFQEARATRSVNHPNVVKILDFGEDEKDGLLYLVMELLQGESLAAVLERGPMDETTAVCVAAAVADGLHAAHERGIIHRDLKPGNIFLASDGQVKLLDFGLAKVSAGSNETAVGIVVGTPQYMAPEQILKKERIGPRTDVYGLGAVLFRMVTGRLPFVAEGIGDFVRQHLSSPAPRASQFAPVSAELDALLLRCLEKEPLMRPASMVELKDLLTQLVGRQRAESAPAPNLFTEESATMIDVPVPIELLRAASQPRPIVDPSALPGMRSDYPTQPTPVGGTPSATPSGGVQRAKAPTPAGAMPLPVFHMPGPSAAAPPLDRQSAQRPLARSGRGGAPWLAIAIGLLLLFGLAVGLAVWVLR